MHKRRFLVRQFPEEIMLIPAHYCSFTSKTWALDSSNSTEPTQQSLPGKPTGPLLNCTDSSLETVRTSQLSKEALSVQTLPRCRARMADAHRHSAHGDSSQWGSRGPRPAGHGAQDPSAGGCLPSQAGETSEATDRLSMQGRQRRRQGRGLTDEFV